MNIQADIDVLINHITPDQRTNEVLWLGDNQNNIYMYVHTTQSYLSSRWTEMDPLYVLETVVNGIEIVAQQLKDKNISIKQVKCTPLSYYSFFSSIFLKSIKLL